MIEIAAARARARSDQRAFLAADQRAAYGPDGCSNSNVLHLAMAVTIRPTVRQAVWDSGKKQEYEG